jgi:hypothetical protein
MDGNLTSLPRTGNIYDAPLIVGCNPPHDAFIEAVDFIWTLKTLCPVIYDSISVLGIFNDSPILSAEIGSSVRLVKIGVGNYSEKALKLWILLNRSDFSLAELEYADVRFHQKIYIRRRSYGSN